MHIVLDDLRISQHLFAHRMCHQKIFQPVPDLAPILRPVHQPLVKHHPHAHVAPLERDPPAPPAVARHMVRRRPADPVYRRGPFREFLCELQPVPILHAFPPAPRRGGRVLRVRFPPPLLPRKHRGDPRCIHDPAGLDCLCRLTVADRQCLFPAGGKLHARHARGTQYLRPRQPCAPQHLLVESRPVELIRWQTHLILRPQLARLRDILYIIVLEPETQPLFH